MSIFQQGLLDLHGELIVDLLAGALARENVPELIAHDEARRRSA